MNVDNIEPDEHAARARLGKAIRNLGHTIVGNHNDAPRLDRAAAELEAIERRLNSGETRRRDPEGFGTGWGEARQEVAQGEVMESFGDRPFCGRFSPWGVDMVITREGDEAVARVTLGSAHEGAPGRCHGGIVAGIIDDVFGFVQQIHHHAAFTGTLSLRYEKPTPLHVPLVFRARLDRIEGRKLFMNADAWHANERLVTAEALFIGHVTPQ
jgi:acyl-coenzyme A thioesterase PaaI-like protein